ncbi:hypothetical protein [Dyadobacter bucti]|uniref:hypothetical protein n=1 Tax=Dyadobacter bucti TaxID=2572203 RepID=UPI003F71A60A
MPKEPEDWDESTYSKLVHDNQDVIGMITYALYKADKINYCNAAREIRGSVTTSDIEGFHIYVEPLFEKHRRYALEYIKNYLGTEMEHKILNAAEVSRKEQFWADIVKGILGSFLYSLLIVGVLLVAKGEFKFRQIVNAIFETKDINVKDPSDVKKSTKDTIQQVE